MRTQGGRIKEKTTVQYVLGWGGGGVGVTGTIDAMSCLGRESHGFMRVQTLLAMPDFSNELLFSTVQMK
jgi:hypothetical protein